MKYQYDYRITHLLPMLLDVLITANKDMQHLLSAVSSVPHWFHVSVTMIKYTRSLVILV